MSQRRMFSPQIVESDEFLEMPPSSQSLYFHLGMKADDDGFVQPKSIMKLIGSGDDDLKVLLLKRFVLPFESGVIVIKHWLIHNMIRTDRYKETRFLEEKSKLFLKENKAYTEDPKKGKPLIKESWQPNGNHLAPQVRLGKVSIDNNISSNSKKRYYLFNGKELLVTEKDGKLWVRHGHNYFKEFNGNLKDIYYK